MNCPSCGRDNAADASFCNGCGTKLELACENCGRGNSSDSVFCAGCGRQLVAEIPKPTLPEALSDPLNYTPRHLAEKILRDRPLSKASAAP